MIADSSLASNLSQLCECNPNDCNNCTLSIKRPAPRPFRSCLRNKSSTSFLNLPFDIGKLHCPSHCCLAGQPDSAQLIVRGCEAGSSGSARRQRQARRTARARTKASVSHLVSLGPIKGIVSSYTNWTISRLPSAALEISKPRATSETCLRASLDGPSNKESAFDTSLQTS